MFHELSFKILYDKYEFVETEAIELLLLAVIKNELFSTLFSSLFWLISNFISSNIKLIKYILSSFIL